MSLQALKDNIIEGVRSDGEKRLENRKKRINLELQQYEKDQEKKFARQEKDLQERANKELDRMKRKADRHNSNEILLEKEQMIQNVVADALHEMEDFSVEDLNRFFKAAMAEVDTDQAFELRLGENSKHIDEAAQAWQGDYENLTLADKKIRNKAGFIISQDGKEYNYIFSELLREMKPELLAALNQHLFQ